MISIRIRFSESLTVDEVERLARETDSPLDFIEILIYDHDYNLQDGELEHMGIVDYDTAEQYWKEIQEELSGSEWRISEYSISEVNVSLGNINPEIRLNNSISGEARTRGEVISLSEDFLRLIDSYGESSALEVIYHEIGHLLHENSSSIMDWIGKNPDNALGSYNKVQGYWEGISYNPTESFAQAFALYYIRPSDLRSNFPDAKRLISVIVKQINVDRVIDDVMYEYEDFLERHYYGE